MDGDKILEAETTLISGIHFDLYTFEPYSALEGYILDLEHFVNDTHVLISCLNRGNEFLNHIILTDVMFLYAPSQIALSSLRWAANILQISIASYMEKRFGSSLSFILELTDTLLNDYSSSVS
jgi:cyclin H